MVQHSTRSGADDWPRFMANQAQSLLEQGMSPGGVITATTSDFYTFGYQMELTKHEGQFLVITNKEQQVLDTTAFIIGQKPSVPSGVLDHAKANGSNSLTWQPTSNLRLAIYTLPYYYGDVGGFVIAGQSLAPAESRIETYGLIGLLAWLAIVLSTASVLFAPKIK